MTLVSHILEYLAAQPLNWVHKSDIERMALLEWGYSGDNAARRARELAKQGLIRAEENAKGQVTYKHKTIMEKAAERKVNIQVEPTEPKIKQTTLI